VTPEDRIRAVFDEPVVPLSPPPGTWERIATGAARRRRARRLLAVSSSAAALAVVAAGVTWLGGVGGDGAQPARTPPPSASAPTSQEPTDTSRPTSTADRRVVGGLPEGGPVPKGFVAVSVSTTPGGYVYALGTAPCADAPCTSMVRSDDGGATWVGIPAPRAELSGTSGLPEAGTVRDVRFATPRDGWAFGGGIWQTHDGGATWQALSLATVLDLATDGSHVWAVTTSCTEVPCPRRVHLFHAQATDTVFTNDGLADLPAAADARILAGAGVMTLTSGGPDARLYFTTGTGRWVRMTAPCAAAEGIGELLAVAPPASGDGLVAFCGEPAAGSLNVTTVRGTEGGESWQPLGEPLRRTNGVFSGTAVTVDTLVVATGNADLGGALQVSRSGGREWAPARVGGSPPAGGWRWVAAAGGDRVLALPLTPTGSIYASDDGGATFEPRVIE
jgi:photosystem II stability/assembly factor-like uncharacterized protein